MTVLEADCLDGLIQLSCHIPPQQTLTQMAVAKRDQVPEAWKHNLPLLARRFSAPARSQSGTRLAGAIWALQLAAVAVLPHDVAAG